MTTVNFRTYHAWSLHLSTFSSINTVVKPTETISRIHIKLQTRLPRLMFSDTNWNSLQTDYSATSSKSMVQRRSTCATAEDLKIVCRHLSSSHSRRNKKVLTTKPSRESVKLNTSSRESILSTIPLENTFNYLEKSCSQWKRHSQIPSSRSNKLVSFSTDQSIVLTGRQWLSDRLQWSISHSIDRKPRITQAISLLCGYMIVCLLSLPILNTILLSFQLQRQNFNHLPTNINELFPFARLVRDSSTHHEDTWCYVSYDPVYAFEQAVS